MVNEVRPDRGWRSTRLGRFVRLPWRDRLLLVKALAVLSIVSLLLRAFPVQRVYRMLGGSDLNTDPARSDQRAAGMARALSIARIFEIAARHTPLTSTCLPRSLTLWWLLRREGLEARLRLGARKHGERFQAHAWVEHGGVPIGEGDADRDGAYSPLPWMSADGRS